MTNLTLSKEELCLISIALNEYQMETDNYHLDEMRKVSFTKEEKFLLFDLILDNFPEDKQLQHKFAAIYNKIGGKS